MKNLTEKQPSKPRPQFPTNTPAIKSESNIGNFALLSVDEFFAIQDGRASLIPNPCNW